MNTKIIKIAINNVLKHKRRTLFNSLTFAVNMIALVFLVGLLRGTYNLMIDKSIDLKVGHIKIYNAKYIEEKKRLPLDLNIADPEGVLKIIRSVPRVKGASARIVFNGMLSSGSKKTGMMFYGVNLEEEKKVTTAYNKISGYSLPENGARILAGKRLADLMSIKTGDSLMIFSQTIYRSNNLVDAEVSGIYEAGFQFMEKNIAVVPFTYASDFLEMKGAATEIIVRLDNKKNVAEVKAQLKKLIGDKYPELIVRDWIEEAPDLIMAMKQDMVSYAVVFGILLFLAFFIIVNTLTISVFERIPEIGTLRAIGMEKEQIRMMFMTEGMILGFFGVVLGGLTVIPISYYMSQHGIYFGDKMTMDFPMPMDPYIKASNLPIDWVVCGLICLGSAFFGSLFPSAKAAETNIVTAIKRGVR
jgi:putative ABC transport system permease protein